MRIPFLGIPDKPIVSTSQDFLPIADVADDIILFKNGSAALVMESTSLNFGLLSEREQQSVIAAYAGLLNSFNFPVQILVRSQKKDISSYLQFLDQAQDKITNPKLKSVMTDYKKFIIESVKKKNVLSKKFYIVILFSQYELGIAKSFASTYFKKNKESGVPFTKSYVLRKAKISLYPKRDHLMRQAGRLGITLTQLTRDSLLQVLYEAYNPPPQTEVVPLELQQTETEA